MCWPKFTKKLLQMNRQELSNYLDKEKARMAEKAGTPQIRVCCGAGCLSSGAEELVKTLREEIKALDIEAEVIPTGCMGPCNQGPLIKFDPGNTIYQKAETAMLPNLLQSHLLDKTPVTEQLLFADSREAPFLDADDDPYFKKQMRIALKDCGHLIRKK
jgi:(2Fe-2S) ferredoxin